jgi:hypothetical protein
MPRGKSQLTALELRRQLLVAESELNRAHLLTDCEELGEHARHWKEQARKAGSIASTAALVAGAAGVARKLYRARKPAGEDGNGGWLSKVANSARLAASLWLLFRSRSRGDEDTAE